MSRGVRFVLLLAAATGLAVSEAAFGVIRAPQQSIFVGAQGRSFTVEEDQTYSDTVATFQCYCNPADTFTISVSWGDGSSPSAGTAVFTGITPEQQARAYRVDATHRYTSSGTYATTISITKNEPPVATVTAMGTATVTPRTQPPPPPPTPPPPPPPAPADLLLTQAQTPERPRAGGTLTYMLTVRNRGPGTASGVTLTNVPPAGSTFVSASVAAALRSPAGGGPCTAPAGAALTCALGTVAAGAASVVTHVVRLGPARVAANRAQVQSATTDPVTADNAAAAQVAVAPPPPVLGRSANVAPVSGTVLYRPRGSTRFVPLTADTQIPTGSEIDTRRGRVRLQSALGGGATNSSEFYAGRFIFNQPRGRGAFTELRLAGGSYRVCPARPRAHAAAGKHPKHPVRRLWGNGKGKFRTRGRYGSAAIRGTRWLTLDRCDGTFFRVQVGRVLVRDFRLKKNVLVRAGKTYLARARRP